MDHLEQQFLNELDTKLWKSADRLRFNLDAANYKHVALGLIILKYVSDAFGECQDDALQLLPRTTVIACELCLVFRTQIFHKIRAQLRSLG